MVVKHNLPNKMDENPIVPEEAIIPQEELEPLDNLDDTDDVEALKSQIVEKDTFARQAVARAKKAEDELKILKKKAEKPAAPVASNQSVEETVLLANGMDEELLSELKAVAKVRETTLLKAQADPIFVAVKEKFEADKKAREAALPASRGSGHVKPKLDFKSPGLTREQHKALVESRT